MNNRTTNVQPWPGDPRPSEAVLRQLLAAEGLHPYRWSNDPGDVYAAHSHTFDKVIVVVHGSITFGLPGEGRQLHLQSGDRLDLPAGVVHDATVGPAGVACLEAHR